MAYRTSAITNKNDDDPILELKTIPTESLEKTVIANVPFYVANGQELLALSMKKLEAMREGHSSSEKPPALFVQPLDPYRITWLQRHKRYLAFLRESFINLPDGGGMLWMSRRYRSELPAQISVASYGMNLIRLAQAKNYSLFIVGGKDKTLEKLAANLRRSFPALRIVGKHHGFMKGEARERVLQAIRKTDPHIIFIGLGHHAGLRWTLENRDRLRNAIVLNISGALDTLAGEKKKAPDYFAERGYTWLWRSINRPWRWHRLILVIRWLFYSLWVYLRHKPQTT